MIFRLKRSTNKNSVIHNKQVVTTSVKKEKMSVPVLHAHRPSRAINAAPSKTHDLCVKGNQKVNTCS